ncbi:MAG TPA: immunoglobulin domain-containing protein, partial [Clostridia bacterium]|nr:immunoglobulin domain-containing protein [Clostridia bacterium]
MRTTHPMGQTLRVLAGLLLATATFAQVITPTSEWSSSPDESQRAARVAKLNWKPVIRDWYSTEWQATEIVTNAENGKLQELTHRYTEVGTGLNYVDEHGQWQRSADVIELMTNGLGGAAALRGPTKVHFPPALGPEGIMITTCSNKVLRAQPVGLYYFDAKSGESVLIAAAGNDVEGELLPPNQVVYRSVLEGLKCDLRYTYCQNGFESDLVILERPQPPEAYGLNPETTRLELWHAINGSVPARIASRVVSGQTDPVVRGGMMEPDLIDDTLDFGDLFFPQGYAFSTMDDGEKDRPKDSPAKVRVPTLVEDNKRVAVAKRWGRIGEQSGLIEAVNWRDIKPKLDSLPQVGREAKLSAPVRRAALELNFPRREKGGQSAPMPMRMAKADYQPEGLVLDYITVPSSGTTYSFSAGQTYFIGSSGALFTGQVDFWSGCVIKYTNDAYLCLKGPITCLGGNPSPSVFTSEHDNALGETLPWSTGTPAYSAAKALHLQNATQAQLLNSLKIRWAKIGLCVEGGYSSITNVLANSAIQWCQTGILVTNASVKLMSSTTCNVTTPIATSAAGTYSYAGSLTENCPIYNVVLSPTIQDVCQGSNATIQVTHGGTPPFSYQWKQMGGDIVGATTSTLVKTNVKHPNDTSSYSVVVSNAQSSESSGVAVINVKVPLSFTSQPQSQTVAQGSNVTFTVSITGSAPAGYQWTFNGSPIPGATAGSSSTNFYTITNVQPSHAGNYAVIATNTVSGITSSNVVLTVIAPPSITTQPQSRTAVAGSNVTFTVAATGTAPLSYQWRFNATNIVGATSSSFTTNGVQSASAGNYSVVVTNVAGSVIS